MLTSVDREVLVALLLRGDNSRSNLSDITDRHPNSVGNSLKRLGSERLVVEKGAGVYTLTYSGANTSRAVLREFAVDIDVPNYPGTE